MTLKTVSYLTFLFVFSLMLSACNTSGGPSSNLDLSVTFPPQSPTTLPKNTPESNQLLAINTSKGQIVIQLNTQNTPNASANFLNKADSGFYNNLTFHRVEPGFVIQGGDPSGTGTGGGTIKSELNTVPFIRGSVGLARTPETPDISNDSQFFICLSTINCSGLTGEYVNFGQLVYGFDVADNIAQGDKIINITSKTK